MLRSTSNHILTFIGCFTLLSAAVMNLTAIECSAEEYDTFLEPNQIVDISSPYRGRINAIHVLKGERVEAGQLLAELDTRVLEANLASAKIAASFHGRIDSAKALVAMRENRYSMLEELERSGNARPQEMKKAKTDLAMAKAQLQSALDDQTLKRIEMDIITAQIEDKKLRSPIEGVVIKIEKQEAELIGGNDKQGFITIVQLDPLKAVFHLPPEIVHQIRARKEITIKTGNQSVSGSIDFISPVINAQSGTVEVSVTISNPNSNLMSGSRCTIQM